MKISGEMVVSSPIIPTKMAPTAASSSSQSFHEALGALGAEVDKGEGLLQRALGSGRGRLAAGDLIALQAGIYRYSEAVDLSAKLVERAGSAVRTVVQGNNG